MKKGTPPKTQHFLRGKVRVRFLATLGKKAAYRKLRSWMRQRETRFLVRCLRPTKKRWNALFRKLSERDALLLDGETLHELLWTQRKKKK